MASAYVCPYETRGYRLRDGCCIFTAEVEAINEALTYGNVSTRKRFVIFSDSMSALQAIARRARRVRILLLTGSCRHVRKYYLMTNWLHFVGFRVIEISHETNRLIVLQKMLYQKHNLHILNCHVHMFLWRFSHLSHLCGRNDGIKRLVANCTPSCPKLMRSITRDVQIEKIKLLLIAFE